MVYPNEFCIGFCYWMLNTSWQVLTPPRLALITTVYNAAVAGSSVTSLEYNNFTQTTYWRLPFYEAYLRSIEGFSAPPLSTYSYLFDPSQLRSNYNGDFGFTSALNLCFQLKDVGGSIIDATQSTDTKRPFVSGFSTLSLPVNQLSWRTALATSLTVNNAASLTNAISQFTVYLVARNNSTAIQQILFYISTGSSSASTRFDIRITAANLWQLNIRPLDAGAPASLLGGASNTQTKIITAVMDLTADTAILYENGSQVAINTALGLGLVTSPTDSLLSSIGSSGTTNYFQGQSGSIATYVAAHTPSEVSAMVAWLNQIYHCF